jgi:hypothetical protein
MKQRFLFLPLLLLVPFFSWAQFPTAIGTKWEFFQFYEDVQDINHVINTFQDEVVGDTVAGAMTWQIVRRTGTYYSGIGFGPSVSYYDTLDGTWYYRVQGGQVWTLDSVVAGTPYESMLYEFGLALWDTSAGIHKNLLEMTAFPTPPNSHLPLFCLDSVCANHGYPYCADPWVLDTTPGYFPVTPASLIWNPHHNIKFRTDIGTLTSNAYSWVLGEYGSFYHLKRLSSNGQVLYENPLIATGLEKGATVDFAKVFPNPSTGLVNISASIPLEIIQVLDMTGKMVHQHVPDDLNLDQELDLGNLPKGMYWLKLEAEGLSQTKPLILR